MENLIGKILANRYRIDGSLGGGGMAEIYKAWDQERATYLALKVLRQDLSRDRVFLRRFQREAQTLETLKHPNIVRFYGIVADDLTVFILMEYIEGTTLQDKIFRARGAPLNWAFIGTVINAVCSALHYAHQQGQVHCDIKPGNIMIDESGKVLLTDFGIARKTDAATATMVGFGTPAYMAPGLVQGRDPTPQSDIYSLGVVLYEMVTGGERPFTGEHAQITGSTSEKVRWEQVHLDPPSPRQYNLHLSPGIEAIILKCLEKDPQKRYTDILEISNAIETEILKEQDLGHELRQGHQSIDQDAEQSGVIKGEARNADADEGTAEGLKSSPQVPKERQEEKAGQRRFPSWLPWFLLGILAVLLVLVMVLGRGSGDRTDPNLVEKMQEMPFDETLITISDAVQPSPTQTTIEIPTQTQIKRENPTQTNTVTESPTMTVTQTKELGIGSTKVNPNDGGEMVYVPAGEILMGSEDSDADDNEKPEHIVYLDAFWIYKYEVTNAQFTEFLNTQGNQEEDGVTWLDASDPDARIHQQGGEWVADDGYEDHPVVEVSWYGADTYCQWAGGRLPTEAEWEKAARGTGGSKYPWGDTSPTCNLAKFADCPGQTVSVGSYPNGASPYGALDMAGNAWEWCMDWYAPEYYSRTGNNDNPQGPMSGDNRILRGGAGTSNAWTLRSSVRGRNDPGKTNSINGFRCFRSEAP